MPNHQYIPNKLIEVQVSFRCVWIYGIRIQIELINYVELEYFELQILLQFYHLVHLWNSFGIPLEILIHYLIDNFL